MEAIEFLANIKEIRSKNLASGDKEVWVRLSVVGADTVEANKLANLPPEALVKVQYERGKY